MKLIKIIFSILLISVLLFLFTACKNSDKSNKNTIANLDTPTELNNFTEETTDSTVTSSTSNTNWASNDFEKMIPEPPFSGWTKKQIDDYTYEMEAAGVNAPDYDGSYYKTFENYAKSLENYGYTVTGEVYKFTAEDTAGNRIELRCGDGYAWITINKKRN